MSSPLSPTAASPSFPPLPLGVFEMLFSHRSAALPDPAYIDRSLECHFEHSELLVRLHCQSRSLEQIGGDVFETVHREGAFLHVIVGDAAGHGIGAGIMANEVMVHFHSHASTASDPAEILAELNAMIASWDRSERFMTALVLTFDLQRQVLTYCSAGHPGVLQQGTELLPLAIDHPPLGVMGDFPFQSSPPIALHPGMRMGVWTDGFNELANEAGTMLGDQPLLEWWESCATSSPEQTTRTFFERAAHFSGKAARLDDMTLLVAQIETPPHP